MASQGIRVKRTWCPVVWVGSRALIYGNKLSLNLKGPRFRELLKVYKNTWYLDNVGFDRGKDLIYFLLDLKRGGNLCQIFSGCGGLKGPRIGENFSSVHIGIQWCREGAVVGNSRFFEAKNGKIGQSKMIFYQYLDLQNSIIFPYIFDLGPPDAWRRECRAQKCKMNLQLFNL